MKVLLAWKEELKRLQEEKKIVENQLQFSEPNSLKEEYSINKLNYLDAQINFLIRRLRK